MAYQPARSAVTLNSTLTSRGASRKLLVATTAPAPISSACFRPATDFRPNASVKLAPGFTFNSLPNITAGKISGPEETYA